MLPVTIYIADRPLLICHAEEGQGRSQSEDPLVKYLKNPHPDQISGIISDLEKGKFSAGVIEGSEVTWAMVLTKFLMLSAAGGLVEDREKRVLFLFRRGKWDLPKGKREPAETPGQCALREVSEETGLKNLHIISDLGQTWHSYKLKEKRILKPTQWFRMSFSGTELPVPQVEEDITDIQWILPANIPKYLKFSYPNIKEVFERAGLLV